MMKLPSDETMENMNGDGYLSDEYEQLEMMPAPIRDGDFSEYMWMENEEEFNSQVLRELEEEELMEQCLVAMLDDEESQLNNGNGVTNNNTRNSNETVSLNGLSESVNNLSITSNEIRSNTSSTNSDNNFSSSNSNRPNHRFSVQGRLQARRFSVASQREENETEQKSTLNPDAKEFVPLSQNNAVLQPENEHLPS